MLFLMIAAAAAPERGLLFASTGGKPNGCTGHGPESSKCGEGKENWICKATPKQVAPDCRECSDPTVEGYSDLRKEQEFSDFWVDCPVERVVKYPPECCHIGGAFVLEELHTAATALLGNKPEFQALCSTPGLCKEWANGTGFGASSNGFAYGVKYTEVGGPNDGTAGCLVNREVLNDERLFPNTPGAMGLLTFFGFRDDQTWVSYFGNYSTCDYERLGNDTCNDASPYAVFAQLGYPGLPQIIDKKAGTSPYSNMVQECTDDDPLDWQAITEATYSMARNPDTSCVYGAFVIQNHTGEQSEKCIGIDPFNKEKALTIKDAKDLLARFHEDKSSVYNPDV